MKRILSVILVAVMLLSCFALASCEEKKEEGGAASDFKLGVICLHDEKSTYDLNFIEAVQRAAKDLGLKDDQIIIKKNLFKCRLKNRK